MASGDIPLASPLADSYDVEIPSPRPWLVDGKYIIHGTGEMLDIQEASDNELGRVLLQLKEIVEQITIVKHVIDAEIVDRMDREAEWTMHVGGIKLTAPAPNRTEFNGDKLKANLAPLVEAGEITLTALEAAVEPVTEQKPRKRGINALLKRGGKIAKAVKHAEVPVDKRRNVRVEVEA